MPSRIKTAPGVAPRVGVTALTFRRSARCLRPCQCVSHATSIGGGHQQIVSNDQCRMKTLRHLLHEVDASTCFGADLGRLRALNYGRTSRLDCSIRCPRGRRALVSHQALRLAAPQGQRARPLRRRPEQTLPSRASSTKRSSPDRSRRELGPPARSASNPPGLRPCSGPADAASVFSGENARVQTARKADNTIGPSAIT